MGHDIELQAPFGGHVIAEAHYTSWDSRVRDETGIYTLLAAHEMDGGRVALGRVRNVDRADIAAARARLDAYEQQNARTPMPTFVQTQNGRDPRRDYRAQFLIEAAERYFARNPSVPFLSIWFG